MARGIRKTRSLRTTIKRGMRTTAWSRRKARTTTFWLDVTHGDIRVRAEPSIMAFTEACL